MALHLLDGPESPQEHCRHALMYLDELERGIRALGLVLPDEQAADIFAPLAAARGRLWLAVTELEDTE